MPSQHQAPTVHARSERSVVARLGERTRDAGIQHVKEKAARDILTSIDKWRSSRILTAKRRWIFELMQNASDTAKIHGQPHLKVEFVSNEGTIVVRHNAGWFSLDELSALIYGGSTKPYEAGSEYLGRFGSGLLVSHIVNRKITVLGYVKEGDVISRFNLIIDRSGQTDKEIAMSIENCFEQLNDAEVLEVEGEVWTEYIYQIVDPQGAEAAKEGLDQLRKNLVFVLGFNNIEEIAIGKDRFTKSQKQVGNAYSLTAGNVSAFFAESASEPTVQVGVPYEGISISDLAQRPTIFVGMPLTESADYVAIPFVMNCAKFTTTPDRDTLENNETNSRLLTEAFSLYERMVSELSSNSSRMQLKGLYRLLRFELIPQTSTSQNPLLQSFNDLLIATMSNLTGSAPLVQTIEGQLTVEKAIFPDGRVDGKQMAEPVFVIFFELVKALGKAVPLEDNPDWVKTAGMLSKSFPDLVVLYSLGTLKEELQKFVEEFPEVWPTFEDLAAKYHLTNSKKLLLDLYGVLDSLYESSGVSSDFIAKLLPNQEDRIGPLSRQASSKTTVNLALEDPYTPLTPDFKEIVTQIGFHIREQLVHNDFSRFSIMQSYVHEKTSFDEVLTRLASSEEFSLSEKVADLLDETAQGWISLFKWCVKNGRLVANFPLITKGLEIRKLDDTSQRTLLLPFKEIGLDEQFEGIFPENRLLSASYFPLSKSEDIDTKRAFRNYPAFVVSLPCLDRDVTISFDKLRAISQIEGDLSRVDHTISSEGHLISLIPFWSEIIGRISEFDDRARLLFRFAFDYLARNDKSWRLGGVVSCSCKDKTHTILQSAWLAGLKSDSWVPLKVKENDEEKVLHVPASRESIEKLFSTEQLDTLIAGDPEVSNDFLPHFHFDKLDLKIKLHSLKTGEPETNVRESVSGLVNLVGVVDLEAVADLVEKDPMVFQSVLDEMQLKVRNQELKSENTTIGLRIQDVISMLLESEGLKVKPIQIGGDLEVWPDDNEGSDFGSLQMGRYVVEVKSTRGSRVHLSRAQSELALSKKQNYAVLVIADTGSLREHLLETTSVQDAFDRFGSDISGRSHVLESIHSRLGNFPNPDEVEPDINGYWIKERLWSAAPDLRAWLKREFGLS